MSSRISGDLYLDGTFQAGTLVPSLACLRDAHVAADAAIAAAKLRHEHRALWAQPNTTATTETRVLHVVVGATGSVLDFRAGSIAPCAGAATISVDLKKNGSSILSAPIVLDSSSAARVAQEGTIADDDLAAGDVLEAQITATAGGGTLGTGLFLSLGVEEGPVV